MTREAVVRRKEFRHDALLYASRDEFIEQVADFVTDGLVRGEPAVVAVSREKIEALQAALGANQPGVIYHDMDVVGRNPARLIPRYHRFINEHAPHGPSRGVGEPIGAHRRGAELAECEIHEALCNLAFKATGWWVLCPYDTSAVDPGVVEEACRNHPTILERGRRRPSAIYCDPSGIDQPLGEALPAPPGEAQWLTFSAARLDGLMRFVLQHSRDAGVDPRGAESLVLAVDKVVTSVLRRFAGDGQLVVWHDDRWMVAEVHHPGPVTDPLVGREAPGTDSPAGRILRTANQLCDLVQVRADRSGTVVRLHAALAA